MKRALAALTFTFALTGCTQPAQSPPPGVDYFDVPAGATPPGSHPAGHNPLLEMAP